MTTATMKRFSVLFLIPTATIDNWSKTDPDTRAASEKDMRTKWEAWTVKNSKVILSSEVGGKTKSVTAQGVADVRNEIVITAVVEGESHEAIADLYKDHPHLEIPTASIQVMEIKPMNWTNP